MIRRVKTENGWVCGLPAADPRITSYKGIPFAAPPVGELRWKAPQPCKDWEGDLQAYSFAPIAMQAPILANPDNLYDREFHVDRDTPMSEDCLYLNVWAPAGGLTGLPVYVWYYGGGLQVGYTSEMEFDGERIARRGIVVVTVCYRLNVFGFLAHPEITRESPEAPTNFGFLDQQAATNWVKRNIAAFGGDPENITIGGQSAGGMSVAAQICCRQNKGLFQKAVIESGMFAQPYSSDRHMNHSMEEAEQNGVEFFKMMGVSTLEEARKLDALTLRDTLMEWEKTHGWATTFGSVNDGVFDLHNVHEWYWDPERIQIPLFVGSTADEFVESPSVPEGQTLEEFAQKRFGENAAKFLSCFTDSASPEKVQEEGAINAVEYAIYRAAAQKPQMPLYVYKFAPEIPGFDHPGAFHSSDLWFFFETLAKCWRPYHGVHYDLARQMCDYLCNFIRKGDPNGLGSDGAQLPEWDPFTMEEPTRMIFDQTSHPESSQPSQVMQFLLDNEGEGKK